MRKVLKGLAEALSVILVLAAFFGAGFITAKRLMKPETIVVEKEVEKVIDLKMPGEVEKRVVTVEEVESKLMEMAELTTYGEEYTVTLGKDESRKYRNCRK